LYEAAQNFYLFSNIQEQNYKNQKHIAVDVLFKAYPMILLSGCWPFRCPHFWRFAFVHDPNPKTVNKITPKNW
jgi:hypothetical protein